MESKLTAHDWLPYLVLLAEVPAKQMQIRPAGIQSKLLQSGKKAPCGFGKGRILFE